MVPAGGGGWQQLLEYAQWRFGKAYEFGELTLAIDLEAAREWCRRWRRVVTAMRNTNSAAPINSATGAC